MGRFSRIPTSRPTPAALALVLVALSSAGTVRAAEIVLRTAATPEGTVVRLGDVADVRAADRREAERLAAIPLMPAPPAGRLRYLRMREVQDLVVAHGVDAVSLRFQGATVIEIASSAPPGDAIEDNLSAARRARRDAWQGPATDHAASDEYSATSASIQRAREQLTSVIAQYLQRVSGDGSSWRVTLIAPSHDLQRLPLATSPPACSGGQAPWTGKQRFQITFATADGNAQIFVAAHVTRQRPVVVTITPLERGSVVTAANVQLEWRDDEPAASTGRGPLVSMDQVIGMEAARPLPAGRVLQTSDVEAPLLVKRGDEVTVYARGGGIQVRTFARARQDGARGELIQLESLETRERYDAVVVGTREAVVFAGNTNPTADATPPSLRSPRR